MSARHRRLQMGLCRTPKINWKTHISACGPATSTIREPDNTAVQTAKIQHPHTYTPRRTHTHKLTNCTRTKATATQHAICIFVHCFFLLKRSFDFLATFAGAMLRTFSCGRAKLRTHENTTHPRHPSHTVGPSMLP